MCQTSCPQRYALGLKEVWEVPRKNAFWGTVVHTVGWPLGRSYFGGGFVYHMNGDDNDQDVSKVHVGLVVGLDYKNPYLKWVVCLAWPCRRPDVSFFCVESN